MSEALSVFRPDSLDGEPKACGLGNSDVALDCSPLTKKEPDEAQGPPRRLSYPSQVLTRSNSSFSGNLTNDGLTLWLTPP